MARYEIEYIQDMKSYIINTKYNNLNYLSTYERNNKKIKRHINKSLNKYDYYDTVLEGLLKSYKLEINDSEIENDVKNIGYEKTIDYLLFIFDRYKQVINSLIDFNYITLDMAIKLVNNGFLDLLPKRFKEKDFYRTEFDEEYIKYLYEKYNKLVVKDQIKYIEEEKRSLEYEQERVKILLDQKLLEMANLSKYRNDLDETYKKLIK